MTRLENGPWLTRPRCCSRPPRNCIESCGSPAQGKPRNSIRPRRRISQPNGAGGRQARAEPSSLSLSDGDRIGQLVRQRPRGRVRRRGHRRPARPPARDGVLDGVGADLGRGSGRCEGCEGGHEHMHHTALAASCMPRRGGRAHEVKKYAILNPLRLYRKKKC